MRARYGLRLEPITQQADLTVVLVHGFNSSPISTAELIAPAREAGFHCGDFAYPNDQSLHDSAQLLSSELKQLARREPTRKVALVTHSMGGLVARECIENPDLDPGNVSRLIMVAPPSHGSMLAKYATATDLWEHWISRRSGGPWRRVRDAIVDGLGEAADDLQPGSDFLTHLNERSRHPEVHYTLVIGTGASVTDAQLSWLRDYSHSALMGVRAKKTAANVQRMVSELEEIVEGKGDGVVAVKRAKIEGVDDVVVLPFGHLQVAEPSEHVPAIQARQIVLSRLLESGVPSGGAGL